MSPRALFRAALLMQVVAKDYADGVEYTQTTVAEVIYTQEGSLTELIWEGKYDKDGHKVAPLRVRLPFQTVETVNESAQERQRTLDLFSSGRPAEWRNRLIWGDKKYVLPSLMEEFAGQVNLIYIDPPYNTGQDFSFHVQVDGEEFTKEPS